jgi:hypothetical protein
VPRQVVPAVIPVPDIVVAVVKSVIKLIEFANDSVLNVYAVWLCRYNMALVFADSMTLNVGVPDYVIS